ncbi:ATP-binding protein [Paenibacillus cremeus]|uniref:histidine kinase n=1 Tax=Paenibacillus cremeus TaxID=2163881 RepID=A0A559JPS6_9BACL|nr:ATP-binding protein [Paenibacillus cremeus]TVY01877.1 PAS domain S-box protein [Paenibacillus cremeus]
MFLYDYVVNLSIFSLLVSSPLVIRSFIKPRSLKQKHLWVGLYAGIVSVILVMLSVKQEGYSYDIRYAPVILMFSYFGPAGGLITGVFVLLSRLFSSGNWQPAITGWVFIMLCFTVLHRYVSRFSAPKKCVIFSGAYIVLYLCTVFYFHILVYEPLFHVQYLLFVLLGVLLGCLLIESYERLRRITSEKQDVERTLEESEFKYQLIAEHSSDLIVVMDKAHAISYFSPSHQLVLGYPCGELVGSELRQIVHPDDVRMFESTIEQIYEKKDSYAMEIRLAHKDGRYIQFESRCSPVQGHAGRVEHMVMTSRDISERKKAEEILLQSEKLSIVGELAAGVAHEIRNPLTTLKGFLQLYKSSGVSKYNDLLLVELERIETITSELLTLAKPQAVQLTCTEVRELMDYTVEMLAPQALLNNIEFIRGYGTEALPITCASNQIKQVFLNILKNAMEAMPRGGEIRISLCKEAGEVCLISIQDQGSGISEEMIPRLGQPFYSLKEKGTGLGLMISHKIIKQHQGSITYQSKLDEGTLIEIRLPMESAG